MGLNCRAVRFEITGALQGVYYCHCRECQKHAGSAFQTLAVVANSDLARTEGITQSFSKPAHGDFTMRREFCSVCCCPLYLQSTQWSGITMISVAALDDPEALHPEFQIWTSSRSHWAAVPDDIKSFPRGALDGD